MSQNDELSDEQSRVGRPLRDDADDRVVAVAVADASEDLRRIFGSGNSLDLISDDFVPPARDETGNLCLRMECSNVNFCFYFI